jgi:SAM-dependent methyltransferase
MDAADREHFCQQLALNKMRLGLPLEAVRRIDHYLADDWGIRPPPPPAKWKRRLRELGKNGLAAEYLELHDALASYYEVGSEPPADLETVFYDTLADPRICGHVHSQKRTEILDAGCLLVHLAQTLKISGPVLDIGCHTGHHAHLLAREIDAPVVGIDLSTKALETARAKTAGTDGLTFSDAALSAPSFAGAFEMLYAVRSIDLEDVNLGQITGALQPGGVAVILPSVAPDDSPEARTALRDAGLGWGLSDVVGGWVGEERSYEAGPVLVLIKGGSLEVPADFVRLATETWDKHFKGYANDPDTPLPEKTQAYCRGHWMAKHPL